MKGFLMGLALAVTLCGHASAGEIERAALQVAETAIAVGFEAGVVCQRVAAMADDEDQEAVDLGACRDKMMALMLGGIREGVDTPKEAK